jgi:hypothetical protein
MVFAVASPAPSQNNKGTATVPPSLSKGLDMGSVTIKPIPEEKRSAVFMLFTSWIPGEGRKGFIRYRINAAPDGGDLKEVITYMQKLTSCSFNLELYDSENFKLRTIPLTFSREISSSGDVVAMSSIDMSQMDLAEYKSFIPRERWTISWVGQGSCSI